MQLIAGSKDKGGALDARTVGCVNKNLPNQSRKGYKERQAMVG